MPFTGRYHLIRNWWLPTGSISAPFVLDRRDMALRPYLGVADARDEWGPRLDKREAERKWQRFKRRIAGEPTAQRQWRLAERLAERDRSFERVAALFGQAGLRTPALWGYDTSVIGIITTLALDSAYTAGSAGDVSGVRYQPGTTRTLNSVYFFVSSYTGTAANVNDLNLELRPEASTGALTPDTATLTESKTKDPASATGWIASTGWTTSLTALNRYFIAVGDADGNGTDYATVNQRVAYYNSATNDNQGNRFNGAQSTAGWSSGNTFSLVGLGCFVLAFADGSSFGNPISTLTTPASNTQQRGLRITTSGLIANVPIFGVTWATSGTGVSGFKIFTGDTAPDGSADHTSTSLLYGTTAASATGCFTSTGASYTLTAGTAYSIVATYSVNGTTGPRRADIGTGEDATLRLAMPGAGEFYWRQDGGGSTWANDLTGSMPTMGLMIDGQVAASGGTPPMLSAGGGLLLKAS